MSRKISNFDFSIYKVIIFFVKSEHHFYPKKQIKILAIQVERHFILPIIYIVLILKNDRTCPDRLHYKQFRFLF